MAVVGAVALGRHGADGASHAGVRAGRGVVLGEMDVDERHFESPFQ